LYELTNHLGNVLATITDKPLFITLDGDGVSTTAELLSAQDYYPFGMQMPGRTYLAGSSLSYRYGFNGKEKDDEVMGAGNEIDYGMRVYDPRAGRFLSVDPITKKYPELTPYQFASNRPIQGVDRDGLEFSDPSAQIFYWIFVKPFFDFSNGAMTAAQGTVQRTSAETGQASYNNDHVPQYVQDRLAQNDKLEGIGKQTSGTTEMVVSSGNIAATYTPLFLDGMSVLDQTLSVGTSKATSVVVKVPLTTEASTAADLAGKFVPTSGRTTTILGRLADTRPLAEKLGGTVKSGMNEGGFNILKIPDQYYSWEAN
jgi:RHS repeat-associated protein